jgi:hypothetical protein
MPIRLCQKCGLKVLIDETQAGVQPFYCQRCTTAMKGQEGAGAPAPGPITPVKNPTPSPVTMGNRSDPAAPSVGAAKAATVRVLCPYCKASFNGRVPTKPARGSCPVCQKELILLPNGDIKPAAGFDLTSWQNEPAASPPALKDPTPSPMSEALAAPPKESGTRLLVKKYAADPSAAAASASPAPRRESPKSPAAETDVSDEPSALPPWLDDSGSAPVKPLAETAHEIDVVEPRKDDLEDRTIKVEDPPPPSPPPAPRNRPQAVAKMPSMASGRPPAAVAAPAPAARPTTETARRINPSARPLVAKPAAPAPEGEDAETGAGKVFLALVLALLPIAACAGLLSSRDKVRDNKLIANFGARFHKGLVQLNDVLFKKPQPPPPKMEEKPREPEPPPKEEPPKADPEQQKKDEISISHLYNELLMLKRKYGKEADTAATPQQKADFQTARDQMSQKEQRIKSMRETYQKMYGKDYDPSKE